MHARTAHILKHVLFNIACFFTGFVIYHAVPALWFKAKYVFALVIIADGLTLSFHLLQSWRQTYQYITKDSSEVEIQETSHFDRCSWDNASVYLLMCCNAILLALSALDGIQ